MKDLPVIRPHLNIRHVWQHHSLFLKEEELPAPMCYIHWWHLPDWGFLVENNWIPHSSRCLYETNRLFFCTRMAHKDCHSHSSHFRGYRCFPDLSPVRLYRRWRTTALSHRDFSRLSLQFLQWEYRDEAGLVPMRQFQWILSAWPNKSDIRSI